MAHAKILYPALTKSYKGLFPFRIGTTSFIYPDHYIPNVKMLGPYLDEIELLLFESKGPDALPSGRVIDELAGLADDFGLTYNVHLPTDVSISDPNPAKQRHAVDTNIRIMELVNPLAPSVLTLHIPYNENALDAHHIKIWQDRVYGNLEKIRSSNVYKHTISIETLDYQFEIIEDIVFNLDLTICLDLGHLMVSGFDIVEIFNKYAFKTTVIHLHGVENRDDHKALDRLADEFVEPVVWILKKFTGVVSLEIFSFENLTASLNFLEKHWGDN